MVRVPVQVKVLRGHVKYEGVTQRTLQRYRRQVLRFFDYLDAYNIALPRSPDEFDYVTGEYINHLYQDMDPYGYAGDFLSGIRRFLPRWRPVLPQLAALPELPPGASPAGRCHPWHCRSRARG